LRNGRGVPIDLQKAANYYKLAVDQGHDDAQYQYGIFLRDGNGLPMDLTRAAHFLKLAADQQSSTAQIAFAALLWEGRGISKDRNTAARYFRLAAEEGVAEAQYRYGMALLSGDAGARNIGMAIRYLQLSAKNGNPDGQFIVACMAENGIALFASADLGIAVRYYERCCDLSPAGAASLGWCFQTGRGIPVDFTAAAECFKKAADSDDPDGVNCFGCCLEDGRGVDPDIDRAVSHYERAASLGHPDALFNLGRCLEYGKGIDRDPLRAAKCYRRSAEKKNAAAQNRFGICLERGIGAHKNLSLAAEFYRRAADQGDADGANNFGFCLEHGRGIDQNFEMAARYYKLATDCGHPEAKVNYARCLRLLGRWEPPDRSFETVSHPPSPDRLTELFRPFLENPEPLDDDDRQLLGSLQRIKAATATATAPPAGAAFVPHEIHRGRSSVVRIALDSESNPIVVKKAKDPDCAALIRREGDILTALKHPLVIELRARIPGATPSIVTEFAGNGSLAGFFKADAQGALRRPNRIAKVIAGIALAMRFVHSRGVIHRDLNPDNILLDWDWTVRIADFGRSSSLDAPPLIRSDELRHWPVVDSRHLAPECYDDTFRCASDVFAFGLILFEILIGRPVFPERLDPLQITFMVAIEGAQPEIPDSVRPPARALIEDCWEADPGDRPTFEEIVGRLEEMQFKVTADVNSAKVVKFVRRIEEWERQNIRE
jgi:TPR repeat protein